MPRAVIRRASTAICPALANDLSCRGTPRRSRRHALRGPRDIEFLRTGAVVQAASIEVQAGAAGAELVLFNGTGHRLPTAEPRHYLQAGCAPCPQLARCWRPARHALSDAWIPWPDRAAGERHHAAAARDPPHPPSPAQSAPATARLRLSLHYFLWPRGSHRHRCRRDRGQPPSHDLRDRAPAPARGAGFPIADRPRAKGFIRGKDLVVLKT